MSGSSVPPPAAQTIEVTSRMAVELPGDAKRFSVRVDDWEELRTRVSALGNFDWPGQVIVGAASACFGALLSSLVEWMRLAPAPNEPPSPDRGHHGWVAALMAVGFVALSIAARAICLARSQRAEDAVAEMKRVERQGRP